MYDLMEHSQLQGNSKVPQDHGISTMGSWSGISMSTTNMSSEACKTSSSDKRRLSSSWSPLKWNKRCHNMGMPSRLRIAVLTSAMVYLDVTAIVKLLSMTCGRSLFSLMLMRIDFSGWIAVNIWAELPLATQLKAIDMINWRRTAKTRSMAKTWARSTKLWGWHKMWGWWSRHVDINNMTRCVWHVFISK